MTHKSGSPSHAESALGLSQGTFPFTSRFIDVSGSRIHYVDEGTGPVFLMLHGNPTWSFLFRKLIVLLRDRFRCIAPDLPGFGLSTATSGSAYLPEEHARVIAAFVDGLGLETLTPVVHDWGGPIGFHVDGLDPNRIELLVIGNTWSWPVNGDFHFEHTFPIQGKGPMSRVLGAESHVLGDDASVTSLEIDHHGLAHQMVLLVAHRRVYEQRFFRRQNAARHVYVPERVQGRLDRVHALAQVSIADVLFVARQHVEPAVRRTVRDEDVRIFGNFRPGAARLRVVVASEVEGVVVEPRRPRTPVEFDSADFDARVLEVDAVWKQKFSVGRGLLQRAFVVSGYGDDAVREPCAPIVEALEFIARRVKCEVAAMDQHVAVGNGVVILVVGIRNDD